MKLARFVHNSTPKYGMIDHDKIYPLAGTIFDKPIREGRGYALNEVRLLSPVMPSKAICLGLNYRTHAEELGYEIPKHPAFFMKPSSAVIGTGEHIIYPHVLVTQMDYEGELAVVMGRTARHIEAEDAAYYILGYTVANDVTARNLQPMNGQWTISKSFDTFLPVGPWVETKLDPSNLDITLCVNRQVRQQANTSDMIFSIPEVVSYLSKVMTLNPGDLILMGTPSGVGELRAGDFVTVEIEGIGRLENKVVSEV
ncbi:MAG: fumarylacetoacetate hydrolase family protein [Firmicutes bacterium]|nr:fumarylacetoacetate hydrolase family protein [Bacillota bacterium]MBQ6811115.1 fumarylacetoacetate hydrolase family protein [Bacillota bacterium]